VRVLLRLMPHRVGAAYWKRHQCPAYRPNGICCIRRRHDDDWHRDGRNQEWRDAVNGTLTS
jgi:hypothetical protein